MDSWIKTRLYLRPAAWFAGIKENAMQTQSLSGNWQFRQVDGNDWLPASVPGGVHTDLLAAGRIPDPFVGDNEYRVAWVAEAEWEYRRSFNVGPNLLAEDQVWLVCDGLDTLATVRLNGHTLGSTDNMFRQYCWDIKPYLHPANDSGASGDNELTISFGSSVKYVTEKQALRPLFGPTQSIPGGPHLRKAPCQFGWDWGPQLPPVGIWKDLRLEGYSVARLEDVHVRQSHSGGQVVVEAHIVTERWSGDALSAELRITTPDGETLTGTAALDADGRGVVRVTVDKPQLWWPNGYGAQPLYRVDVLLRGGSKVLDQQRRQIGLRTIELRQEPDQWGRTFVFVVNGTPIFAKGSNWIPADSFPTRISDAYLEGLIRSAADTHHNMLRVWGGGLYEEERFYDLCDRYGILVWQEFIFSCSVYPLEDPAFIENLHVEAVQNMRRIRHRASLCLWCGNNEMEWGWHDWNWDRPELQALKAAYDQFFHRTLREWCATEDADTPYWPSSPSSDLNFKDPNGQKQGDAHYWEVWHGRKPFTAYRDQFPRFMSEFGFQALPPLPTVRTYAAERDWNITSYIMEQHQKNASGNVLMVAQMLDTFRLPKDFPSMVYLSMVLQAEGIRYGVEHWRRHTDRVAGTLYWQLNDCWPVASWSSLDFFGRWKALHYAARRFYAPIMMSIEDKPPVQSIAISSDLCDPWEGTVRWSLETLNGQSLASGEERVNAAPSVPTWVCRLDFADKVTPDSQRETILVAELWQGDHRVALQVATFVPTKHIALQEPVITAQVRAVHDQLVIDVTAQSLARLVELSLDGADVVFSDNYFDLPANRSVTITGALPSGWTAESACAALKVRSVYDSFAERTQPDRCVLAG